MSFTFRPAKREHTPLIIGLAGPTKSGKTLSAHRLAVGLAQGGPVAMINAEGAKGHQYAEKFTYLAADIERPYRPERYTEVLRAALAVTPLPAVVIIDSMSHMHDGPGGLLEWHDEELDRLAGQTQKERDKKNWTAWIKPKAAENQFIYTMLEAECHLILCFRAKEKLKIVTGRPPIELGWQPIAGERIAFETIFTLILPPHCKGVPDLEISDMREPFDTLIPKGKQLSEETGRALALWAAGGTSSVGEPGKGAHVPSRASASADTDVSSAGLLPESASPTVPSLTKAQAKKLNLLVGQLRKAGHIRTEQLWGAVGREPVLSEDGLLHWSPLRDSLSKDEASSLIDRLERFAVSLRDSPGRAAAPEGDDGAAGIAVLVAPDTGESVYARAARGAQR